MKLKIIAICSDCHTELHQSIEMSKSKLKKYWDRAVLGAVNIPCNKCSHRFPNFNIDFKIRDVVTKTDYPVTKFIRVKDKGIQKAVATKFLETHKDQIVEVPKEGLASTIERIANLRKEIVNGKGKTGTTEG